MADHLICGACGFSNEPERVYCHSCGAKLDRSLLPVAEQDKNQESTKSARKRIKKMTNPSSYSAGQFFKTLLSVIIYAAIAAAIFLIAQKPEGVPEEKNEITRLVQSELMEVMQSPISRTIAFSEAEVNATLQHSLKRAAGGGSIPGIEFRRGYARLRPDVIHIGAQQSLWGYPVFSGVDYRLPVVEGKLKPTLVGGNFGRLSVHPAVMQYLTFAFQKLWAALEREHSQVEKMQTITIRQEQIIFVTKPAAAR